MNFWTRLRWDPLPEDDKGASFLSPTPTAYDKYLEHINTSMGADTCLALDLHLSAEINFRRQQSDTMCSMISKTVS